MRWIGKALNISRQRVGAILDAPTTNIPPGQEHPRFRRRLARLRALLRILPARSYLRHSHQLDTILGFSARKALIQVGQWETVNALLARRRRETARDRVRIKVRRYAKHLGHTPTMRELTKAGLVSPKTAMDLFGSVRQMQRESGCLPTRHGSWARARPRPFRPEDIADLAIAPVSALSVPRPGRHQSLENPPDSTLDAAVPA